MQLKLFESIKRKGFIQSINDVFVDKNNAQIFDVDVECDYYDIPRAKGNKGLRVALLDPQLNHPVLRSDGMRYRAIGGQIIFRPTFNTTPTRGNTLIKHAEIKIPYSPIEGSLWRDGDLMELAIAHQRYGTANTGSVLYRSLRAGKSSNINNNVDILPEWAASATNEKGFADNPIILRRIDCTTITGAGNYTKWKNWNGATSTEDQYGEFGNTNFDNMDMFDSFIQVGLRFSAAPAADAARVMFFRCMLQTCGE